MRSSSRISVHGPVPTTCPCSSRYNRSATSSVARTFCSTSSTDNPLVTSSRMCSSTSTTSRGASPTDGSSRMSSRGAARSARPMATICRSPPLNVEQRACARAGSCGNTS